MGRNAEENGIDRRMTRLLAGAIFILVVLSAVGGVLTVGDHLNAVSPVLGGAYYLAVLVVALVGVGYPLICISKRPVLCLYQLKQAAPGQRSRYITILSENLQSSGHLDEGSRERLHQAVGTDDFDAVAEIFKTTCMPLADEQIKRAAKRAFLTGAVAQGALVEALGMLCVSLDAVRGVVEACGFRPTRAGLARLYLRVMASALIAGGVEDMDLDELFGQALGSGAAGKASGFVLGTATDGLVSAYLVFRIGAITRDYLFAQTEPKRESLRRASFAEAATLMKESGFVEEMGRWARQGAADMAHSAGAAGAQVAKNAAQGLAQAAKNAAAQAGHHAQAAADGLASTARATADGLLRKTQASRRL